MRMRGKSRSQLTVRYTCKAYSGIDHVLVLVNVMFCSGYVYLYVHVHVGGSPLESYPSPSYSTVHTLPASVRNIFLISSRVNGREPSRPRTLT